METLNLWLSEVHPLLETLYYLSAVALAILAFKGLEQLKITREIAKTNNKREAFKLAAEECKYFAEQVVPSYQKALMEIVSLKLPSFINPIFRIEKGEIVDANFSVSSIEPDLKRCGASLVTFLNKLEAFSIFFASGIAEESVAYRETGDAFCGLAKKCMPGIFYMRSTKSGRFESTVMLYERWSATQKAEQLLEDKKSIDKNLESLKQKPIRPIGTE